MVHVFSEEFEKLVAVLFCLVPVPDEEGGHDHELMFFQKLHRLHSLLRGLMLFDIFENGIGMVFEAHHKLIDPGLPKTVQEIFIPDHEVCPGLQPEVLIRPSLKHLLDEPYALLASDVEGIVTHVENIPVILLFEELKLIGDQFWTPSPPGLFVKGRFRAETCNPRGILLKN